MDWKILLFFLQFKYETIDISGPSSPIATNTTSLPVTITTEKPEGNDRFLSHTFNFKTVLFYHISWLSFEAYNIFLGQLAEKWQLVKVQSVSKMSNLLNKTDFFQHFELWWAAIFEPVDLEKHYICKMKALKHGFWNLLWKLKKTLIGKTIDQF